MIFRSWGLKEELAEEAEASRRAERSDRYTKVLGEALKPPYQLNLVSSRILSGRERSWSSPRSIVLISFVELPIVFAPLSGRSVKPDSFIELRTVHCQVEAVPVLAGAVL